MIVSVTHYDVPWWTLTVTEMTTCLKELGGLPRLIGLEPPLVYSRLVASSVYLRPGSACYSLIRDL